MPSLADLMERAGLVPLSQPFVEVPNYKFPVIFSQTEVVQESEQPLMCAETPARIPDVTVLYFTLPGCENCLPGLRSFQALAEEVSQSEFQIPKICFRVVVSDWPTRAEIEQELKGVPWKGNVAVVWDAKGVLSERMAVLAQPAFFVLDSRGQVAAYQSGPVEFGSPGFEVFWKTLVNVTNNEANKTPESGGWIGSLHNELPVKSNQTVIFLNNGGLSVLWLVTAGAVCYSLIRFFLRLRKNFKGSQNSS